MACSNVLPRAFAVALFTVGIMRIAEARGAVVSYVQGETGEPHATVAIGANQPLPPSGGGLLGRARDAGRRDGDAAQPRSGYCAFPHERRVVFLAREFPEFDLGRVTIVNGVVSGGFETVRPEVVLHTWNTAPVDDYQKWGALEARPTNVHLKTTVVLNGAPDDELVLAFGLPGVSATYEDYLFTDDSVRSVAFWDGATFDLQKATDLPISPYWKASPAQAGATEGLRVQTLIKIGGQWKAPTDWTDEPSHSFCRDTGAEHIEELVVIIPNSQFLDPGKRAKPPG